MTAYRYALYFTPAAGSPWAEAGARWLGRDPASGAPCPQQAVPGVTGVMLAELTTEARRYGMHATLKAPFRLAEGFTEDHLLDMAQAFCAVQAPLPVAQPQVQPMGSFLALRPHGPHDGLGALAMRCVSYFDLLRAAPGEAELARRRRAGLSERQEQLLQRWGYPYTEEEFRFHITLTDSLALVDAESWYAIRKAAEQCFAAPSQHAPLVLDGLTIAREAQPGEPFSVWRRLPFGAAHDVCALPPAGRLFFCVGPSGVGKDSLLNWVRQRVAPQARVRFARRVITRPAHDSETHEAVDLPSFWKMAGDGHFAMSWQANDLCYGIRRGIEAELKAGCDVVVNGSREYVPQLRLQFPDAVVIWIDAEPEMVRARIAARQREAGPALLRRQQRVEQFAPPEDAAIVRLDNSGPIEEAGRRLLSILHVTNTFG